MPFDGQNFKQQPVNLESLPVDERRKAFCEALRGQLPMPWDYCGTDGCAIGFAHIRTGKYRSADELGVWLGIGAAAGEQCCYHAWESCGVFFHEVTPAMVADLIEKSAE